MNNKNTLIGILGIMVIALAVIYSFNRQTAPNAVATTTPQTDVVVPVATTTTATTSTVHATTTEATVTPKSLAITQSDNGKTVHVKQGTRFAVSLGELNWNLNWSDMTVVSRVKNIMVMRGSQGVYTADKVGSTVLTAEGRPICAPGEMCAQYIIEVKVTVVVDPQ